MKKKVLCRVAALALSVVMIAGNAFTAMADEDLSYLKNVDNLQNTRYQTSEIRGVTYPTTRRIEAGENLYWENTSGGTDYHLVYTGPIGDYKAAGYEDKFYPNAQIYSTYDAWTTPSGVTIDYLRRVLDENGKIKTATAEQLGVTYEAGKIRDVPYDSNYPLKRVVDFYALNIERITKDNLHTPEIEHHDLRDHNLYILLNDYIICRLSGQTDNFHNASEYFDETRRADTEAICDVLRNWLNSFDFEHMSEMDRAKQVAALLKQAHYDDEAARTRNPGPKSSVYRVLVEHKGICQDFAATGELLAALVGLKHAQLTSATLDHMAYAVQVDGVPYEGENGFLDLSQDWRTKSRLGSRQTLNYHYGEYISYR